jgi:hypothetical protein
VKFPLGWLLEHASGPIRYRALRDVAGMPELAEAGSAMAYGCPAALQLALAQQSDGTWGGTMLATPSQRSDGIKGAGTVSALRRLLEFGWDKESPPLVASRRLLFRLLAEDNDPAYLFEIRDIAGKKQLDEDVALHGRQMLREAAAATLAQAGYEHDPRLRGAAKRILDRITEFLEGPYAEKPWVRVGNKQVLPPEASPPSIYALHLLAHLPLIRTEHHTSMELIYNWISQPHPRQAPVQQIGEKLIDVPHYVLGDQLPHRNALDNDTPAGVAWLELMARLGFLKRNEGWSKLFERLLDDRGRDAVWHPHKGMATPRSSNPYIWHWFPLDTLAADGDERWTDLTFRLGLIAKLSGRQIDVI